MTVNTLSLHFLQHHPQDAAKVLEHFEPEQLADYFNQLPALTTSNILRYITPVKTTSCLIAMDVNSAAKILEQFSIERTSSLIRRMPADVRLKIIKAMPTLYANMIKLVIKYPVDTVGRNISPNVFTVLEDMHVRDVLSAIKGSADQVRSEIYVVNDKQRLEGVVFIRELLTADQNTSVKKIMRISTVSISARSRLAQIQHHIEWKYNDMLPVVDRNGLFIGVLKRSVMLDVLSRNIEITQHHDDAANTALVVAELFWNTCTDLLVPEVDQSNRESQDGSNKQ